MQHSNIIEIRVTDIPDILERSEKAGNRKPPLFLALPGLGKSQQHAVYAAATGRKFYDIRLGYYTPSDVRGFGVPNRETHTMEFFISEDLPPAGSDESVLIHWDELTNALPATQKCALQGVLDRKIGQYSFPRDSLMSASGNRTSHNSHCESLSMALVDRFAIYNVIPGLDDTMNYLQDIGGAPLVVAFLSQTASALYDPDVVTEDWDGEENIPSARSFERLSELIKSYKSEDDAANDRLLTAHAAGCIGTKNGKLFANFVQLSSKVGDVTHLINNADTCKIPNEMSIRWIIACKLVSAAKPETVEPVLHLARRLLPDPDGRLSILETFVGKSLQRSRPELMTTPIKGADGKPKQSALTEWTIKNAEALTR